MEDIHYIFFYHYYIDENDTLLSMTKSIHDLGIPNELSSDELINIICDGKKKFKNRTKVFSIVVHNNFEDPLEYLRNDDNKNYLYATNGLKNINFKKTSKHFFPLNTIHIFYKYVTSIDTKTKKINFSINKKKTRRAKIEFEKEIE